MNYTALMIVSGLVAGAAVLWIALAAKMVADDEEAKASAERERRKLVQEQQDSKRTGGIERFPGN